MPPVVSEVATRAFRKRSAMLSEFGTQVYNWGLRIVVHPEVEATFRNIRLEHEHGHIAHVGDAVKVWGLPLVGDPALGRTDVVLRADFSA
jgi:hypothetical protein